MAEDVEEVLGDLPLLLLLPAVESRSALAPKLRRRPKGELGDVLGAASPSSIALSSMELLPLLDPLSVRFLAPVKMDWVGELPRPKAVMEVRRRC